MFKEKFKSEFEKIKPNEESKASVLKMLEEKTEKTKNTPLKPIKKVRFIGAVAAVLAICVISALALRVPFLSSAPQIEYTEGIPARVTYAQIYDKFSQIAKAEERSYYYLTDEDGIVLENAVEGDTAMPDGMEGSTGTLKGENTTAKPSDTATDVGTEDFSTTNTQVADVDEADIVKTDGKFIYSVSSKLKTKTQRINISKAEKGQLEGVALIEIVIDNDTYTEISDIYLNGGTLAVIINCMGNKNTTVLRLYDVSTPYTPKQKREVTFSGNLLSSRLINNNIYLFTNESFYKEPVKTDVCSYVPSVEIDDGAKTPIAEENICIFKGEVDRSYTSVFAVDLVNGNLIDSKSTVGGGATIYANTSSLYLAANDSFAYYYARNTDVDYKNKTRLIRFDIKDGVITPAAEGEVDGTPLNQFSMDEMGGYFRIVTTVSTNSGTTNEVSVLDKELKVVGKIKDIAKGERVYSVRFMGDIGYFVTFRQVDPLFAVDLKDPKNPKILSALKIPGFSNYMHPWGEGLMLGIGAEADEKTGAVSGIKLSMFDISSPENLQEKNKEVLNIIASDVGVEHKSILANYNKNLIGFAAMGGKYYVYGYSSKNGFTKKAELEIPINKEADVYYPYYYYMQNTRGIYIGDYFYLVSANGINSYKLSDFSAVDSIVF